MHIGYERIFPTPAYPAGVTSNVLAPLTWTSKANSVVVFKSSLKDKLRQVQLGRCCYCRRMLGDSITIDLEHFIEKAAHPTFTFAIQNLALSCRTCNGKKNEAYLRLCGRLSRNSASPISAAVKVLRCPTLTEPLTSAAPLPTSTQAYRWVHPHFDEFSTHIAIKKNWIFSWKTKKGLRTIRGLRLNALAQIERRAIAERLAARAGAMSLAIAAFAELDFASAKVVCMSVASELRRRRNSRRAETLVAETILELTLDNDGHPSEHLRLPAPSNRP